MSKQIDVLVSFHVKIVNLLHLSSLEEAIVKIFMESYKIPFYQFREIIKE